MKPKVTVGVCVRNSAATLREAIKSIISQDFPHELMEVIFVDDGSEDSTLSIVQEYVFRMDIAAKVFCTSWQGLGAARNLVVENAEGKYIIWVDGDMILPKDHVRKQVEFMEQNPKVGIAKAKYGMLDEENLFGFLENVGYIAVDSMYGGKPTLRTLGTGGSIYRVEAIRQVGGFDVCISGVGEDMDAEARVRRAGWLLYLGSPAVFYERRRKSLRSIWRESLWHGYGGHYFAHKNGLPALSTLYKMFPPAAILDEVSHSFRVYKLTHRNTVFLLPFHWAFKRIAWCLGFIKSHIEGYGHVR
jgi:glycosyltransferase involved in cell wall biosynthesis